MDIWIIIATFAIILTSIQMIPQVIKTFNTKKVRDVSLWMIIIIMLGSLSWFSYGIHIEDKPVIIANTLNFIFASTLFYFKMRY